MVGFCPDSSPSPTFSYGWAFARRGSVTAGRQHTSCSAPPIKRAWGCGSMYQVPEWSFQAAISGMIPGSLCRPPASCSNSADLGWPSGQSRCCNSPQPPDGPLLQRLPPTSEMPLVVGWGLAPGHSSQTQPFPGALKWLFPYDPVCACCVFGIKGGAS